MEVDTDKSIMLPEDKTEIGVMILQGKECQKLSEARGDHGVDSSQQLRKGTKLVSTLTLHFSIPEL